MKKISILALSVVLTATLFAGCRNSRPMETTRPTTAPTTQATTAPATHSTQPSTTATQPSETAGRDNGPMDTTNGIVNPSNGTDGTVAENNSGNPGTTPEGRIAPMPRVR